MVATSALPPCIQEMKMSDDYLDACCHPAELGVLILAGFHAHGGKVREHKRLENHVQHSDQAHNHTADDSNQFC